MQTFAVIVAPVVPKNIIFVTNRSDADSGAVRVVVIEAAVRPTTPPPMAREEFVNFRVGSVAGAESRLVLRIVLPSGDEDKTHDEPLANEVLENLRKVFKRLPDGHYRIYQIQPDGVERLVVDVIVREGRSIDASDEALEIGKSAPPASQSEEPEPSAPSDEAAAIQSDVTDSTWHEAAVAWGGYSVLATRVRGRRRAEERRPGDDRSLTKIHRILRRPR